MNLVGRLVIMAITGGVVCACVVVFIFGVGLRVHHAWYALVPAAIGAVILLVMRRSVPET